MNRMVTAVVCAVMALGCLGESDDGGTVVPPPETGEPAPSCGEVAGRCSATCYGTCDGEESTGECSGSCNGACCTP